MAGYLLRPGWLGDPWVIGQDLKLCPCWSFRVPEKRVNVWDDREGLGRLLAEFRIVGPSGAGETVVRAAVQSSSFSGVKLRVDQPVGIICELQRVGQTVFPWFERPAGLVLPSETVDVGREHISAVCRGEVNAECKFHIPSNKQLNGKHKAGSCIFPKKHLMGGNASTSSRLATG